MTSSNALVMVGFNGGSFCFCCLLLSLLSTVDVALVGSDDAEIISVDTDCLKLLSDCTEEVNAAFFVTLLFF